MASAVHAPQHPYPTPSFSRISTGSSIGAQKSLQGDINPFSGSQSVNTTPTQTPPSSRGHQPPMSFPMGTYGPPNGIHLPQGGSRGYGDVNGSVSHQQYPMGQKPQIYTAVYSGVSVYEMEVNRIAVMRRRADSWLNATQILKVAGVDKGKRTKVLEKEILAAEHEKVQGGYGKYQGTWINYKRGREFCKQYGVEELLRPLLEYDMGQDGVSMAGQGNIDTPTKEQAMAAQRKKMMYNNGIENRPPAQSPNSTFFKSISAAAATAVNAMSKTRIETPGPRPASGNKRPAPERNPSQQMGSQESAYAGSSQQSMQSLHSETSFGISGQLDPAFGVHSTPYFTNVQQHNPDFQEPPRKRARASSTLDPYSQDTTGGYDRSMRDITPTEANDSFLYHQPSHAHLNTDQSILGVQPLPQPTSNSALKKKEILIQLFLESPQTDFSNHEPLMHLSGEDLDIPMDGTAHTALHWAATLGRTSLVRTLIVRGASIHRVNGGGETALIRAALTTNNLDQGSFPELLELLGPTIEMRDGRGRTVLHHLAVSSAVKGRSAACKYYLECLLEFVVRQGSASNSQQNSFHDALNPASLPRTKSLGLARFMTEIVNAQDLSGDTALNLAARIGNKSIIQQLIEVGADPTIANRGGLKPVDFGVGGDPEPTEMQQSSSQSLPTHEKTGVNKVGESSRDLMTSFTALLSDTENSFRSELQAKQSLIDQAHTNLREMSSLLGEEKRRLEDLQRKVEQRKELQQHIMNLKRANQEQRAELLRSGLPNSKIRTNITLGEADNGLEVDVTTLPTVQLSQPLQLSPQQHEYLVSLPDVSLLQARVMAYQKHNAGLVVHTTQLKSRSAELEKKLRRVVTLCTDVPEEKLESMIGSLVTAVESEKAEDVEVGRVREFLRKVESVESGEA